MKKRIFGIFLITVMTFTMMVGCGSNNDTQKQDNEVEKAAEAKDSVIVAMGPSSEPEAGFDPAYGWVQESKLMSH